MKEFITRTKTLIVLQKGNPIFSEGATEISIEDEAAGEFLEIHQYQDDERVNRIAINPEEWPHIRRAVDYLVGEMEQNQQEPVYE